MKRAVRQKESVLPNAFFSCTARDNCHGYLKTVAGTHQAPAEICRRVAHDAVGGTRTRELSESGALRVVLRTYVRTAVHAALSVGGVSRADDPRRCPRNASLAVGAGCVVRPEEWQGDLGLGALL